MGLNTKLLCGPLNQSQSMIRGYFLNLNLLLFSL